MARHSFAAKLDHLLKTRTKPDGSPYKYSEIQEGVENAVSAEYIRRLHQGSAENPGYKVIRALAEFFEVPPGYFFPDFEAPAQADVSDPSLDQITTRAAKLDSAGRRALLELFPVIEKIRKDLEGGGGSS